MTTFGTREIAPTIERSQPKTPVAPAVPIAPAAQAAVVAPADDKRMPRQRTLKRGIASYSEGNISIEVIIRDTSDTGMRIKIKENDFLPDHFQIFIELDGLRADCDVVWRKGKELGCHFSSPVKIGAATRLQSVQQSTTSKVSILLKRPGE